MPDSFWLVFGEPKGLSPVNRYTNKESKDRHSIRCWPLSWAESEGFFGRKLCLLFANREYRMMAKPSEFIGKPVDAKTPRHRSIIKNRRKGR